MEADHLKAASVPMGLKWRSSPWFITLVIAGCLGTDSLVYTIIVPVVPFQLENLGYTGVSALVGWLLFAYSGGLLVSTIPIALLSERYHAQTIPLIIGLIILLGSQVMFMEAPKYWVMCLARIFQGFSSTVVWVVGLALLCDNVPEENIGRQIGLVMTGFTLGTLLGPPVGGALYSRFGFRGPFIFGIIAAVVDLVGRLLVIEQADVCRYAVNPGVVSSMNTDAIKVGAAAEDPDNCLTNERGKSEATAGEKQLDSSPPADNDRVNGGRKSSSNASLLTVTIHLVKSPRAAMASAVTLSYGLLYSSIETALPLHLQDVWGFYSSKVGLIFIAAVVPTIFSSAIAGWYADRQGVDWVTFACLVLATPWAAVMMVQGHLSLFVVAFAVLSFFASGVFAPVMTELAAISRSIEGVGYAHVYGVFNMAYGAGTTLGPVVGGQMYDHLKNGWTAICLTAAGLLGCCAIMSFCATGDEPLLKKALRRARLSKAG